jgi:uncharacterized membrane protein YagU involved in acid resistance
MRPRALDTILLGGAAIAVLDIANAIIFWALVRGTQPQVILQSVAAGLLGKPAAFAGGAQTAWLGAILHVSISCGIAAVYYAACVRVPSLLKRPLVSGASYGVAVYLVMNFVVIPLSRTSRAPFMPAWFLASFLGHILLVGMPVAFIARWSASRNPRRTSAP